MRAIAAIDDGRFDAEIAPVTVRDAKGRETVVSRRRRAPPGLDDRGAGPTQAGLRRCPTARIAATRPSGTATAGNVPGHHGRRRGDGRRQRADRRALRPQAARQDRRLCPGGGRAEVAVPRPRRGRPPAARSDRDADRGLRPDRDQRGVRGPGRWPTAASSASTGTRSTSTVARSPSATRSVRPEPGSSRRSSTSSSGERAATASRPSASAAAGPWRWPSSGSDATSRRSGTRSGRSG